MKLTFRLLAFLLALVLAWYLLGDRLTPYTSNARVKAVVTPIVPQVSGIVTEVEAVNGQIVEPGTVLARIDRRRFEIDLSRAEAALKEALQSVGAGSAEVTAAQAGVSRAMAALENMRLQTARVFEMERKGLIAVARADDARSKLAEAESAVERAEADLTRAREKLGPEGADNPAVKRALADLGAAALNLEWTELRAPSRGVVADLSVAPGAHAQAGQPLMTFVDIEDVWIDAYLTENNLGHMSLGDRAEVTLDIEPGRIFEGRVESFTGAVSLGGSAGGAELPNPPQSSGWMRAAQRFPVRIVLPGYEAAEEGDDILLQLNGQADVVVYTGDNAVMNGLAGGFIRVMSWLSYAY